MTKQQAKYIAVLEKKMNEVYEALEDAKIGSASEKELRRTLADYQQLLSKVNPNTPNLPKLPQTKESNGFQSCI